MATPEIEEPTIASRRIYDGKVVSLRLDTIKLPNGKEALREVIEHRDAVAIVALGVDNNVILVRQYRKPVERLLLEVPAGVIEDDEDLEECVQRELQEEAGYLARRTEKIGGFYASPGYCTEFLHVFLATDLAPSSLTGDDDENIEVVRIPLADIPALIASGDICDSKSVAGLLLALERLGSK